MTITRARSTPLKSKILASDLPARIRDLRPVLPLYFQDTAQAGDNVRQFLGTFPGTTMYAVKCNPDTGLIKAMLESGLTDFDCASINEVRLVRTLSATAKIYFMHPVKAPEAIAEAYHTHHVRAFVLDTRDELYKILQATNLAADLELFVRVAIPKGAGTGINLSGKFGADVQTAAELLRDARSVCARLGVSFHVGSECTRPDRYALAIKLTAQAIKQSGVSVDALDVGGGFPAGYPHIKTPTLETFVTHIQHAMARHKLGGLALLCEPGRALVANTGSLAVRIEGRRDHVLHLNDGVYGNLIEMGPASDFILPHQLVRVSGKVRGDLIPYRLAGPTCDSYDMMKGPFMLPNDARAGDYILFTHVGAYSTSSQTQFNGFGETQFVRT